MFINKKTSKLVKYNKPDIIDKIYYQELSVPKSNNKLKTEISKIEDKIPLYDIFRDNLFLIDKMNVYDRVVNQYYRFPDKLLLNSIKEKKIKLEKKSKLDIIEKRKLNKYKLMLDYFENFNFDELYNTYIRVFYLYANEVGKNITLCSRPSFMNHFKHLLPFYSRSEVLNMALNMGIKLDKKFYDQEKIRDLCKIVRVNDITSSTLLQHQKYMIESNTVGLIQYYTLHGSYYINKYLRNIGRNYKNPHMEEQIIKPLYKLITNSPAFEKEYILYRFVNNDRHLVDLEIGDIYTEPGFLSTTRNPFYKEDQYSFGFILMKIKIPKDKKGVCLCVETLSLFTHEQEILFAPNSMFKLISKDQNCDYYHTDLDKSSKIKTRYEFEYIGTGKLNLDNIKLLDSNPPQLIDFLTETNDISDLTNENNQIEITLGKNKYIAIIDEFDSTGAYSKFYMLKTTNGISIYSLFNNYILYFIEIGSDPNNDKIMFVNYYQKYSTIDKNKIYTDDEFITFVSCIAKYFKVAQVIIFSDYITCDILKHVKFEDHGKIQDDKHDKDNKHDKDQDNKQDKNQDKEQDKEHDKEQDKKHDKNQERDPETKELNEFYGGSYSVDLLEYLKNNKKKYYRSKGVLDLEISPKFSYYYLDKLKVTDILNILNKEDRDEIYQFYDKLYKPENKNKKFSDFLIWMTENKCYLIEELIGKLRRIYDRSLNPFRYDYYILDPLIYLYNNNYIDYMPDHFTKNNINYERDIYELAYNSRRSRISQII